DRTGLAERTLLLFTTDHGIAFPGAKATLFDPGIEIALIARGPGGFAGGKSVDAMVSNADIMPALLELCGVPVPPGVQGTSLLPLVRGEVERLHGELFVELTYHAAYDPMRGVRTERYKYIRSYEP
ncbi:MAG: sulfatase, partial [Chloroflexota bacterium]